MKRRGLDANGSGERLQAIQLDELSKATEILKFTVLSADLPELVENLLGSILHASVQILGGVGGLLYVRESPSSPHKRVVAAVEDNQVISIPDDPRFRRFEKPIPIEGAGQIIWDKLSQLDDFWATGIDDPALPEQLTAWHASLGHEYLAHFMLRRGVRQYGFLVIAYRHERPLDPLTEQIGKILCLQITMAFELLGRSHAEKEAAVLEAKAGFYRDVHDSLGQGMMGILMQLGAARRLEDQLPAEAIRYIDTALELARENLTLARRSAEQIQHSEQPMYGLSQTIENYIESTRRLTPIHFETHLHPSSASLTFRTEHELAQISREAIHNAVKHSEANTIRVTLEEMNEGGIRLAVEDDGAGFDLATATAGMGLNNIRQRATIIGADLSIASERGLGTTIVVVIDPRS